MKTLGRPQSQNIEDRRNYFGSEALDDDYGNEDRFMDFLQDAIDNPHGLMPQQFQKRAPSTVEEIILHEMTKGMKWPEQTPGTSGQGVIDNLLQEL